MINTLIEKAKRRTCSLSVFCQIAQRIAYKMHRRGSPYFVLSRTISPYEKTHQMSNYLISSQTPLVRRSWRGCKLRTLYGGGTQCCRPGVIIAKWGLQALLVQKVWFDLWRIIEYTEFVRLDGSYTHLFGWNDCINVPCHVHECQPYSGGELKLFGSASLMNVGGLRSPYSYFVLRMLVHDFLGGPDQTQSVRG